MPGGARQHDSGMHAAPRFHQLDFLRGLACLAVVAFHFLHRGQQGGWLVDTTWPWLQSLAALGHLGVHLFFMISGFVILMTAQGATVRGFVASRVARLYPAFWVSVLLTALVAWVSGSEAFAVTPGQVLVNLTMVPQWVQVEFVDGAYWSLAVELQFYLMVIALLHFGQLRRVERWIGVWLLLSSVNVLRPMYPLEFWLDVRWAPLFSAGMLFYRVSRKGWNLQRYLLLLWSFSLTLWYGWVGAVGSKLGHSLSAQTRTPAASDRKQLRSGNAIPVAAPDRLVLAVVDPSGNNLSSGIFGTSTSQHHALRHQLRTSRPPRRSPRRTTRRTPHRGGPSHERGNT